MYVLHLLTILAFFLSEMVQQNRIMQKENLSLTHLIRKPNVASEKAPLAILLHGYGSNEEDLFGFAEELPDELFIISVRAPLPLQPYGHAWYAIFWDNSTGKFSDDEQAKKSRDMIANFIDQISICHMKSPWKFRR